MKNITLAFQNVILQGAGTSQEKAIVYGVFVAIGVFCVIAFGGNIR